MRLFRLILINLHVLDIAIGQITDTIEETEESAATETENIELDGGPVTEEVMEPNITINKPGEPETDEMDEIDDEGPIDSNWNVNRAVRDLAYFLRAHKFQDYDRRYLKSIDEAKYFLHQDFPKPMLRSLHWEVHKHCDVGFKNCLRYGEAIVRMTSLRRNDDTLTVMRENKWTLEKNKKQILAIQKDCQMAQKRDNLTVVPFQGPIERFQWRTTMSYYMCWYTMLETPELEFFGEPCSNHANCLDTYGIDNKDPRANDDKPFACAMYSFCPDHCCSMKHIWYMRDCFQATTNPCYEENPPADRKCTIKREENQDFDSLVRNHINITCNCRKTGFEWSSRFSLCVDINECTRDMHNCNRKASQICINQPGSYRCVCAAGFVHDPKSKGCVASATIQKALRPSEDDEDESKREVKSIFKKIVKVLTGSSAVEATYKNRRKHTFFRIMITCIGIYLHLQLL